MKTKSKNKQGISLIVLVITIIVMIILAAAVILSLSSNGIIDRANEAVSVTDEKQMQVLASTIWADAYIEYVEGNLTEQQLIQRVKDELEEVDKNYTQKYDVDISLKGVSVELKSEEWITIYEEGGHTETGILNLGNKELFNSIDTYRMEIEGEKYTGTLQGKLFNAGSGLYVFAVIENNEITYVTSMQQLQQILLTASAETVAVVVNQVTDEFGNTTCNLVYMNASQQPVATEYKVTKIEKKKTPGTLVYEGDGTSIIGYEYIEGLSITRDYIIICEINGVEYLLTTISGSFWGEPALMMGVDGESPLLFICNNGVTILGEIIVNQIYDIGETKHLKFEGEFVVGVDGTLLGTPKESEYLIPETVAGTKVEKLWPNALSGIPVIDRYIEVDNGDDVTLATKIIIKKSGESMINVIGEKTIDLRELDVTDCGDEVVLSEATLWGVGTIYVTKNAKDNLYSTYDNVIGVE